MTTEWLELNDRQLGRDDMRHGVCHISDVLPLVLARIAAIAQSDTDCRPRPVDLASHIMPAPGVMADVWSSGWKVREAGGRVEKAAIRGGLPCVT